MLDPDGRVRSVVEASGVGAPPTEAFVGHFLSDIAARRDGGRARAEEWERRIALARDSDWMAHYVDPPPGAGPEVAPSVACTVTPIRGADGQLHSILVDIDDRTALLETQKRLHGSEERFRLLAETLPQMVWVGTGHRDVQYFSARWETFTGMTIDELVGRGYEHLIHPDDLPRLDHGREASDSGRPLVFRMRRHDGEYRWLESYVAYLVDDDGETVMTVGGTTDVTDRLDEEERRLLSQKREAIGTLAGGIAHDFNNVIGAILSNASVAQAEIAAGESPATSVSEIASGAVRAADLVRRMLVYSREDEPTSELLSVENVAREVCGLLQATFPQGVTLMRAFAPSLPQVLGDASQLHQVVMNLVTNARQAFGPEPGQIEVSVDLVELPSTDPSLPVLELTGGSYVRLRVRDDGPGMLEAVQQRAFDPFFTTKAADEGTGLGLAAARTIARRHDGEIGLQSRVGVGTTMTLLLPVAGATATEAGPAGEETDRSAPKADEPTVGLPAPTPDSAKQARSTPRVAFVDDETSLTLLAARALPLYGCEPVVFSDPREALGAITADPRGFDVVITDHAMPGLSGLQLVAELRTVRPDLPVVLTSGFLSAEHHAEAQRAGVGAIVSKPCSIEDLAAAALGLASGA